jgi:DNA polymerase (family 10)
MAARSSKNVKPAPKATKATKPAKPSPSSPSTAPPAAEMPREITAELAYSAQDPAHHAAAWKSPGAVAGVLQEIATLLLLTNANSFKVRAYENAARSLAGSGEDLDTLDVKALAELPGVGTSIAEKITTLVHTGQLPYLEELRAQVPAGLLEMMKIPGLGPKKAQALHDGLGIDGVDALEAACRSGRLEDLRGFGAKTEQNILAGIEQIRRVHGTFLWSFAHTIVVPVVEALRVHPAVQRVEYAGSLRRRKETVHDVDLLVATADAPAVMEAFAHGPWAARVLGSGETKTSVVDPGGLQMDLRAVTAAQYPYALHHFTGSKEHNIAMRGRAQRMGIKMNEYGLFRGDELVVCRDEAAIFAAVELEFVPPEMREDRGEIEAAESGALPAQLVEVSDLRGGLHVHTTASDGRDDLETMVRAAAALGWEYVGITDHGPDATWANGLNAPRLTASRRAIEAVRHAVRGIHVFHGIEANVRPDGSLDLEAAALAEFDFVIAAIHDALHLSRDEQTRRLLRVVENPAVTVLGHPVARILLERPGIDADWRTVFEAAARHGVLLEINGHPRRMDLEGALVQQARDCGVLFSIAPDAHDAAGLAAVRDGVSMARRGWLEPRHVFNTRRRADAEAYFRARRGHEGGTK